jgi:hypothetical protein
MSASGATLSGKSHVILGDRIVGRLKDEHKCKKKRRRGKSANFALKEVVQANLSPELYFGSKSMSDMDPFIFLLGNWLHAWTAMGMS